MKRINWLMACLVGALSLMASIGCAVEPTTTPATITVPVPYTAPIPVSHDRMNLLQSKIADRLEEAIASRPTQEVYDLANSLAALRTVARLDSYTVDVPWGVKCSIPKDAPSDLLRSVMMPIGEIIAGRSPIIPDTHPMTTKKKPQSPDIKVTMEEEGMIEADQIPELIPMRNHQVYFPLGDFLK